MQILKSKINVYTIFFTKWLKKCDVFYEDPAHMLDFNIYNTVTGSITHIHKIFTDTLEYWLTLGGNSILRIQTKLNTQFDVLLDLFESEHTDVRSFVQEFIGEFIQKYTPRPLYLDTYPNLDSYPIPTLRSRYHPTSRTVADR
jgi:hypothetical protein